MCWLSYQRWEVWSDGCWYGLGIFHFQFRDKNSQDEYLIVGGALAAMRQDNPNLVRQQANETMIGNV